MRGHGSEVLASSLPSKTPVAVGLGAKRCASSRARASWVTDFRIRSLALVTWPPFSDIRRASALASTPSVIPDYASMPVQDLSFYGRKVLKVFYMAIIYPRQEISRRWCGALQTRLRRAPLGRFLRAHSMTPALTGRSQSSDDLVRATVFIVESGLLQYCRSHGQPLHEVRHAAVGQLACVVSRALAIRISEPSAWRVAALLSTAQLLRAHIGLNAAAIASASLVRRHEQRPETPIPALEAQISDGVSAALDDNSTVAAAEVSALIAMSLEFGNAEDPQRDHSLDTGSRC